MDGEPEDEEVRPEEVLNVTTPSIKEWEEFWQTVDTLKVWSWKKNYINRDVIDGTQWELRIKRIYNLRGGRVSKSDDPCE